MPRRIRRRTKWCVEWPRSFAVNWILHFGLDRWERGLVLDWENKQLLSNMVESERGVARYQGKAVRGTCSCKCIRDVSKSRELNIFWANASILPGTNKSAIPIEQFTNEYITRSACCSLPAFQWQRGQTWLKQNEKSKHGHHSHHMKKKKEQADTCYISVHRMIWLCIILSMYCNHFGSSG